jgi:hypothetical protein
VGFSLAISLPVNESGMTRKAGRRMRGVQPGKRMVPVKSVNGGRVELAFLMLGNASMPRLTGTIVRSWFPVTVDLADEPVQRILNTRASLLSGLLEDLDGPGHLWPSRGPLCVHLARTAAPVGPGATDISIARRINGVWPFWSYLLELCERSNGSL